MKGFTLLEVMVALAITAGVVMTIAVVMNRHLDIVAREGEEFQALMLCRTKLDELSRRRVEPGSATAGTFAPLLPEYSWESRITIPDLPGVRRLAVTVRKGDMPRGVTLGRYLIND